MLGDCLMSLQKSDAAIKAFKNAANAYVIVLKNKDNNEVAYCNNKIGVIFLNDKKYDSSAIYFEKAFNYFFVHFKEEYQSMIVVADNLSLVYTANNRDSQHKNICEKVLPIIEKQETMLSENYCNFVYHLCGALRGIKDFAGMEKWARKLVTIREKMNGIKSAEYAEALDILGIGLTSLDNYNEAENILLKAIEIKKALAVKDTISLATTYNGLADH